MAEWSEEREKEVRERIEKSTKGPWTSCGDDPRCLIDAGVYANGIRIATEVSPIKALRPERNANMEFAAHARTDLPDALDEIARLRAELADHDASFDLRWKSDMRAIKRWQEATGRTDTWPDHTDLSVWLMEQNAELRADVRKLRQFIKSEGECSCFAEEICEGCALLNNTAKWEKP